MMAEVDRDHHWMSQALLQAKSAVPVLILPLVV